MKRTLALILMTAIMIGLIGCVQPSPAAQTTGSTSAGASAAATTAAPAAAKIVRGGSITVAKSNKMTTLNPTKTNTKVEDGYVFYQIFDALIGFDEKGSPIPALAKDWEFSQDGLALTMNLAEGVKFHDGNVFNAEAVKTNLDWFLSDECGHVYRDSDLSSIDSVEVLDDYKVKVNLKTPDAALLSVFSGICGMMMSPESIKSGNLAVEAVGTGPFKLSEYVEGDHITLVKNENYYKKGEDGQPLPYLDKITFRIMTDDSVKTTNLQSGDVDAVDYHSSTNSIMKAQSMDQLKTVMAPNRDTYFMCFNLNDPKLDNVKVRQAFSYAVNREELMEVVLEGIGVVEAFDAAPDQWFYSDYNPYSYDPEKAKALLKEAGYPDGITIKLSNIAREPDNTFVQLIQEQVKASGIRLEIEAMERLAWIDLIRTNRSGEMGIGVIAIQGLDPNTQYNSTQVYLEPTKIEEYKKLLLSAKATYDLEKRKSIFAEYQKVYLDNALHVFLGQRPRYTSFNTKLNDTALRPNGAVYFEYVWLNK